MNRDSGSVSTHAEQGQEVAEGSSAQFSSAGQWGVTLQPIVDLIGEEAALWIAVEFAGQRIYVARQARDGTKLTKLIGRHAADKLSRHFGGVSLTIPLQVGRRARVIEMRKRGVSVRVIAERVGSTERYVYQVLREYREKGGTLRRRP